MNTRRPSALVAQLVPVVLVTTTVAQSQSEIDKALLAAPPAQKEAALVIKWKADFTYDTLRKGTHRLVCYDRSGGPGQQAFSVECTSTVNLPRVAQNLKFDAMGEKRQAALDGAEKDGSRVKPEFGSVFYNLNGQSHESALRRCIRPPGGHR